MKHAHVFTLLLFLILQPSSLAPAGDWTQLQNGPKRLGYSSEPIDMPLQPLWNHGFAPERLHPQAQPITGEGRVYIGTAMGTFYAFDAKTGAKAWTAKLGGPVLHTAGFENGKVFFGCMDGCVYALDAASGNVAWKFDGKMRTGFSTAVLLADGNVLIANRGGVYFALSQKDGSIVWRKEIGVPILMSSACAQGRLFFGAMDMCVYALDARSGQIVWAERAHPRRGLQGLLAGCIQGLCPHSAHEGFRQRGWQSHRVVAWPAARDGAGQAAHDGRAA